MSFQLPLDVYVGSLTRYYHGNWQRADRGWGPRPRHLAQIEARGADAVPAAANPALMREALAEWRELLAENLGEQLRQPLDWEETEDTAYFTETLTLETYVGLLMLAAYEENSHYEVPPRVPENWAETPLMRASAAAGRDNSDYPHLMGCALWVPAEFQETIPFFDPLGQKLQIGSVYALARELMLLNQRTFRGRDDVRHAWRWRAPEPNAPFEIVARYSLAVFHDLAEQAAAHALPVRLVR